MKLEEAIKQTTFKSEDERLIINLMYTSSCISSEQNRFFKGFGISPEQYNVLRILRGQFPNPASVGLIQDRMLDKNSNASRLVEKLKLKQLVKRSECSKDRRQVDIIITKDGLNLLSDIDIENAEMHKMCNTLNLIEKKSLNELLDKLRN